MSSRWSKPYIALIISIGGVVLAHGLANWSASNPRQYLSYLAIALIASILKIKIPGVTGSMSLNFLFVLIGISSFNLGETLAMGCLGTIVQTFFHPKSRPNWTRVSFNVASMASAIQAGFWVHHAGEIRSEILTAIAFFIANTLQVAIV